MDITLTPNLKIIKNDKWVLLYDSKTGKNLKLNNDGLKVITLLQEGISLDEIYNSYEAPNLKPLIDALQEKGLINSTEPLDVSPEKKNFSTVEEIEEGKLLQHLRLNISERCNLDCSYCYERASNVYGKNRIMPWDIAKKSLDEFIDNIKLHNQKNVSIRFFGGEPLINWDILKQSIGYAKENLPLDICVNFILNTNGTLLTDEMAKYLSENNVAISLSLDGTKEFHDVARKYIDGRGSFDLVDKAIDILSNNKCQFNLSVVCNDNNYPHMSELIDYLKNKQDTLNYPMSVNFNNIEICDRKGIATLPAEDKVKYLLETIKYAKEQGVYCYGGLTHFVFDKLAKGFSGKYCGGTGSEFSIDPEGYVFPCSGLDIELGHINDFKDIFKKEDYKNLVRRSSGNINECVGCEIEGICAGGCLADVLSSSGKEGGSYRDCDLKKLTFQELVKEYVLK